MSQMWPGRYFQSVRFVLCRLLQTLPEKWLHLMNFYMYPGNIHRSCRNKGADFESFKQEEKGFPTGPDGQRHKLLSAPITWPASCCRPPCPVPSPPKAEKLRFVICLLHVGHADKCSLLNKHWQNRNTLCKHNPELKGWDQPIWCSAHPSLHSILLLSSTPSCRACLISTPSCQPPSRHHIVFPSTRNELLC